MITVDSKFTIDTGDGVFAPGERFFLTSDAAPPLGALKAEGGGFWPGLPVGGYLVQGERKLFQIVGNDWRPGPDDGRMVRGTWIEAIRGFSPEGGGVRLEYRKQGLSLAAITLSDTAADGAREDGSGPAAMNAAVDKLNVAYRRAFILPDDLSEIKTLLVRLCLGQRFDLVLTLGGTGLAPRDVAPEATLAVIEKRLPGFERAMTMASLAKTPHAAISRAVVGTLGGSLIINLPGSVKAVKENLEAVIAAVPHALDKLQGDKTPCGG